MPLIVNTNVSSMNAQRYLGMNTTALTRTMEKLSSGYRINRASDDAAGLQLSENLRAQIRGSQKALANTQDGINVLNIADGAFQTMEDNLQRIRELTVQAGNDTYATAQRDAMENEIGQLLADIDRIANSTGFNGVDLLSTATPATFDIQVGPNNTVNDVISIISVLGNATVAGLNPALVAPNFTNNAAAQTFLGQVDTAMVELNTRRGELGALVNRMEGTANNISINIENLSSSESRIRNVDVAEATAELTRNQILQQASATILSQANSAPQLALKLLGN